MRKCSGLALASSGAKVTATPRRGALSPDASRPPRARDRRLKMLSWADPADRELREEIERLEAELRALDGCPTTGPHAAAVFHAFLFGLGL